MSSSTPVRGQSRLGAWLWLGCFQFFVAEQIARLGWTGHYSMARDYISDLGAVHFSSTPWVMDGSFVLQGCLIFFGALLVREMVPLRVVVGLLAIAGGGVFVVGLVPEDVNFRLHIAGAVANFLGGSLAMILLGLHMIRRAVCLGPAVKVKSWVTFMAGSIGLIATMALAFRGTPSWDALGWQPGIVERFAAYPLPLWLTWTGYLLLTRVPHSSRFWLEWGLTS